MIHMIGALLLLLFVFVSPAYAYDCHYLGTALQSDGTYRHPKTGESFPEPRNCTVRCDGTVAERVVDITTFGQVQSCPWRGGIKGFRGNDGRMHGFGTFCTYRLVGGVAYAWPGYYQLTTEDDPNSDFPRVIGEDATFCGSIPNPDRSNTLPINLVDPGGDSGNIVDPEPPREVVYDEPLPEDIIDPNPTRPPDPTEGYFIPPTARRSAEYLIEIPEESVPLNGQCHLHGTGLTDIPAEYNNTEPMSLYLNALAYNDWDLYVWSEDRGWANRLKYQHFAFDDNPDLIATNQEGSGTNSIIELTDGLQGRMVCVVKSTATVGYTLGFYREE